MDIPLPVGYFDSQALPLGRFLPPVDEGVISQVLKRYVPDAGLIFDPFGASPLVALEAARSGYPVIVASNNPVNRFVLQKILQPFSQATLQAALAHIAALPKDGSRMEMVLLDLYRSKCNRCGEDVIVEFFVWEKELGGPTHKVYSCGHCAFTGEVAATEDDWNRAADYSRKGLQHAIALEHVAPSGDPDRDDAEAALGVYPGRAMHALMTLMNKLDQSDVPERIDSAIKALLLLTFDAGNGLWSYPEGRLRPRQLVASSRFKEHNLWRALERAVDLWAIGSDEIRVSEWSPDAHIDPGQVAIAASPARTVAEAFVPGQVKALISVPPRPNQAYWSLSALWAAWLWGREDAAAIKVALRRRRYDWNWHAAALKTVLSGVATHLDEATPGVLYIPEAEPGFLEAVLSGFDTSGFSLRGMAFRSGEEQAFLHWQYPALAPPPWDEQAGRRIVQQALSDAVIRIGEPVPYSTLHAAAWSTLARERMLASAQQADIRQPMQSMNDWLADELKLSSQWEHLTRGVELETGSFWFARPTQTDDPLFDRVERMVLELLRTVDAVGEVELDHRVCEAFPGVATPDRRLIFACLESYGMRQGDGRWALRPEDFAEARKTDCAEVEELLRHLGKQLGFEVPPTGFVRWMNAKGAAEYSFQVCERASWGWEHQDRSVSIVIPGGRSPLVAEKARRDPRVREWMETPGRVIKFRHVRRLATESNLTLFNLAERLAIDPPEREDPQMPLL